MVIFHRYSVRVKPGEPQLTLYAADRDSLKKNQEYMDLAAENRPCQFQIEDVQFWYHDNKPNRTATEEEITKWTKNDACFLIPQMEVLSPSYYYACFGDEEILTPLRDKLHTEYAQYLAEWKRLYAESKAALFDRIGEVGMVQTVYQNLLNCCDAYPQTYMKNLKDEDSPLRVLSDFYGKSERLSIKREAEGILAHMEKNKDTLAKYHALDRRVNGVTDHDELMEILNENLDREYRKYLKEWDTFDFDRTIEYSMEIHTVQQLYNTLHNEKQLYATEKLDIAAQLDEPMAYDMNRLIGRREMCDICLDDIYAVLPQMYPDTEPEFDPWDTQNTTEENDECVEQSM